MFTPHENAKKKKKMGSTPTRMSYDFPWQERVNDLSTNEKFDWPVKLKACIGHTVLVLQGGY